MKKYFLLLFISTPLFGQLNYVTIDSTNILGPSSAPSGACTTGWWDLSQDGVLSICKASAWANYGSALTPATVAATGNVTGTNIKAGENVVTFSATPAFISTVQSNIITLTANITSYTLASGSAGQGITLAFCQNATGSFTVSGVPSNIRGMGTIGSTASKCSAQHFTYSANQTSWLADSTMEVNF